MLGWIKQHRWATSVVVAGVLIAALICVSFFVPLYGEICSKDEYTQAKECASYHIALVAFWQIIKSSNDFGAAITAFATIALVGSTIALWSVTRKAADAAQAAADVIPALERPYILVHKIDATIIEPSRGAPSIPTAAVTFRNYGRTPSSLESCAIFVRILDHIPTISDEPEPAEVDRGGVDVDVNFGVGENDRDWTCPICRSVDLFGLSQHMRVQMENEWLFCWGWITYRDIFGNTHPTHFCRRFNWKRQEFEPVGGVEKNYGK